MREGQDENEDERRKKKERLEIKKNIGEERWKDI